MFMDGSFQEKNRSTGVRIVSDESDIAYYMSIDKRCSIYTVEALAIEKAELCLRQHKEQKYLNFNRFTKHD